MRVLSVLLLGACHDYAVQTNCDYVHDLVVCYEEVSFDEAYYRCALRDMTLVHNQTDPDNLDMERVMLIRAVSHIAFDGDPWWSAFPTFECSLEIPRGIWAPADCDSIHPYVCEEYADG